ncbi:MAG TPA: hypothetical protein VH482_26140 [Thermomicrobiales bacterium]
MPDPSGDRPLSLFMPGAFAGLLRRPAEWAILARYGCLPVN